MVAPTGFGYPQDVYRSLDFGQTWATTNIRGSYYGLVALSGDATTLLSAAPGGGIYISHDLGDTWQLTTATNLSWATIACSVDGKTIIAAYGIHNSYDPVDPGPIYFSTNSGATWNQAALSNANWAAVACSADGGKLFAADSNGGISRAQSTPAPRLKFDNSGSNLTLSWLIPSTPFVLEETSTLTKPAWNEVSASRNLNYTNLHYEVLIPNLFGNRFYRLASAP